MTKSRIKQVLYTIEDVCRLLNVSRSTVNRLMYDQKKLEIVRIGRAVRVPATSIEVLLESLRTVE